MAILFQILFRIAVRNVKTQRIKILSFDVHLDR